MYYAVFKTARGWVGILASAKGLLSVTLPQSTQQRAFDSLGQQAKQAEPSPEKLKPSIDSLQTYYSGKKTSFPDKLDFSFATPFQKRVWEAARLIPYGETRSYGWVAGQIGQPQASRAVGQALGRNPFLIIVPCHRVIASDGSLGGFGGNLEAKRALLELENPHSC
ncbi:MAG: methylated-DNA--[protein]-cysteine S-methyltransferase [Dehalococcoidales bacterium]|nr:methylated-DNA--[protein]-cysteine S-methyltransferase [Dehalococcoidales bacterium]